MLYYIFAKTKKNVQIYVVICSVVLLFIESMVMLCIFYYVMILIHVISKCWHVNYKFKYYYIILYSLFAHNETNLDS